MTDKEASSQTAQIRKLFAQLGELVKVLDGFAQVIEDVKSVVNRVAANSEVFVSGYHEHGAEIAQLKVNVDKLVAACPNLRPVTDEFKKVEG